MKLIHRNGEIQGTVPFRDRLAEHAAHAYGFVLNTSERRNRWHTAKEFAEAIAEVYDVKEPHHAAIVDHLNSLP